MIAPMVVQRIQDDSGSHIEPPLDQSWSPLERLSWHAGVAKADADIDVLISHPSGSKVRTGKGPWYEYPFQISWQGSSGISCIDFNDAWHTITALMLGAELYRNTHPGGEL